MRKGLFIVAVGAAAVVRAGLAQAQGVSGADEAPQRWVAAARAELALGQAAGPVTVLPPARPPAPAAPPAAPPVLPPTPSSPLPPSGACGGPSVPCAAPACCCANKEDGFWVSGEYLLWWLKRASAPIPLVTTDTGAATSPTAGGLANPTTQALAGPGFGPTNFSGARLRAGYSLGNGFGIEGSGFWLPTQSRTATFASDATGNPLLFRPVFNVDSGNPNAGSFVALPGIFAGQTQVRSRTEFWGAGALLSAALLRSNDYRLTGLVGFRYLDLREGLDVQELVTDLGGNASFGGTPTAAGDRLDIGDSFRTRNQFYGGELGLRGETHLGRLVLSGTASVALGDTHQAISVAGVTTLFPASGAAPASLPGGVLALPSNSGRSTHDAFSVVPQVGLQLGYDLTARLRLTVGYDFLYWNNVVRPGSQISPAVGGLQVPTSPFYAPGVNPFPPPPHNTTDFWAHGLSFGAMLRF